MISHILPARRYACLLLFSGLSACGPTERPAPTPAPPAAPPTPSPVTERSGDWRDWPMTPGNWRYLPGSPISSARYGDSQAAQLIVQCDAATRRVTIMRAGSATELVIITSTRMARFPAGHIDDQGRAMSGFILNATDGFLDVMAFSRGRIAVTSPGLPGLAVPAWAEPARAIEDCRK